MQAEPLRFALLGHPVGHSISPAMHQAAFAALGLPHTYTAIDVPDAAALAAAVADLASGRLAGANVTLPHKRAALELAGRVAPSASDVLAANVLARDPDGAVVAHNTDAGALAAELASLCEGRPPRHALVLGGGGAGLAAVVACRRIGAARVVVSSRSWRAPGPTGSPAAARFAALGADVVPWSALSTPGRLGGEAPLDLVVQATSAGMRGADPGEALADVVPWARLSPHARAYDVVYSPALTPFLSRAHALGLGARGGLGMLVHQAASSLTLWLGLAAPHEAMRVAAERALAAPEPAE
jgi:shikimate dehydrogenase